MWLPVNTNSSLFFGVFLFIFCTLGFQRFVETWDPTNRPNFGNRLRQKILPEISRRGWGGVLFQEAGDQARQRSWAAMLFRNSRLRFLPRPSYSFSLLSFFFFASRQEILRDGLGKERQRPSVVCTPSSLPFDFFPILILCLYYRLLHWCFQIPIYVHLSR